MSTRLSLTLVALTLSIGATAITTTLPAQAGDSYVSIEQRGWANGAAGSQRGHRNRLTVYQDGSRNSTHSRQYGSHTLPPSGHTRRSLILIDAPFSPRLSVRR